MIHISSKWNRAVSRSASTQSMWKPIYWGQLEKFGLPFIKLSSACYSCLLQQCQYLSRSSTHCNRKNIHTSCRTASNYIPSRSIPDTSYGANPTFNSRPHSLETISAMYDVVLGLVWSLGDCTKESVWILQTYCSRLRLDLNISCVLVVDDRHTDWNGCFLRYGSFWFECHERIYFSLFYDGFAQGHGWRRGRRLFPI